MSDIIRLHTSKRASRVVIHNGTVHVAGMTATDRAQDVRGQTREVLDRIDALLAEAGTDKTRLLTAQIWLKDIASDFEGMNEVWNAWTAADAAPTRATCQCEMATPEILVEIIVTAATGRGA